MGTEGHSAGGGPLLQAQGLVVGYDRPLLPPIDLAIEPRSFWAFVGRNGSGKSTVLRTLLGLLKPLHGEAKMRADARPTLVPQRTGIERNAPLTVRDVVAMGAERGYSPFRLGGRLRRQEIHRLLEEVGAEDLAEASFSALSEGQKQRVLLARALAGRPNLLFLDEPTSAMDLVAEREMLELLHRLSEDRDLAIVIVAHFLPLVREFADRVLFVDADSRHAAAGTPEAVFASEAFRARYGSHAPSNPAPASRADPDASQETGKTPGRQEGAG